MPQFTTLLVGAHFRPPAKQVLAALPAGAELSFELEDSNPYDPNAVKVFVDPKLIPDSQFQALEPELNQSGVILEQLMSGGPVWLGYVPMTGGKPLGKAQASEPGLIGNAEVRKFIGRQEGCQLALAFGPDGSPRMIVTTQGEG